MNLKVNEFVEWLSERGKVTAADIKRAGYKGAFAGSTRDRLIAAGCIVKVEIDNPDSDSPRQRARVNEYHYVKPYTRRKSGRKVGYKVPHERLERQLVRHAISVLTNRGYTVTGPEVKP